MAADERPAGGLTRTSVTLSAATRVIRKDVDRLELARYYLICEFPNIIAHDNEAVRAAVEASVEALQPKSAWRLLEALSQVYRLNSVFSFISSTVVEWYELELPVSAITLTGLRPDIDEVTHSKAINRDPLKFAEWLNRYFDQHPKWEDDPKDLNEFRRNGGRVHHPVLMTRESRGKIAILDGTHRLMTLARAGNESARVYAAVKTTGKPKFRVGDSSFETLERLFRRYQGPADRAKIEDVTVMLAKISTDGKAAVQSYWIDHPRTESVKAAGKRILRRLGGKSSG
jgi:hypothetical protein